MHSAIKNTQLKLSVIAYTWNNIVELIKTAGQSQDLAE